MHRQIAFGWAAIYALISSTDASDFGPHISFDAGSLCISTPPVETKSTTKPELRVCKPEP